MGQIWSNGSEAFAKISGRHTGQGWTSDEKCEEQGIELDNFASIIMYHVESSGFRIMTSMLAVAPLCMQTVIDCTVHWMHILLLRRSSGREITYSEPRSSVICQQNAAKLILHISFEIHETSRWLTKRLLLLEIFWCELILNCSFNPFCVHWSSSGNQIIQSGYHLNCHTSNVQLD